MSLAADHPLKWLETELETDPATMGYAAIRAGAGTPREKSEAMAALANDPTKREGGNRGVIEAWEVYDRINMTELDALPAAKRDRLGVILGMGTLNSNSPVLEADMIGIFGAVADSMTMKNLTGHAQGGFAGKDLRKRYVSRASELKKQITPADVEFCEAN